eukprot:1108848-Amphidinium_carterae.1
MEKLAIDDLTFEEICPGRAVSITFHGPHPLCVIAVHLVRDHLHSWKQVAQMTLTACATNPHPMFLLGDMNVVYGENDVISTSGSSLPTPYSMDGQWWKR